MKLLAEITSFTEDDAKYLIIESDEDDTKGFFLLVYQGLDEPCNADFWFSDLDGAKRQANFSYGVEFDAWRPTG